MSLNIPYKPSQDLPQLDVDLTYPEDKTNGTTLTEVIIDPSGGLTTAISLTGKFAIPYIKLSSLSINDLSTVKLTVDGVIDWNTSITTNSATEIYIGLVSSTSTDITVMCKKTFLFEIQTATDTAVTVSFIARPIL